MLRNLKALGLALVAVFAMSAVGAAGAQAEKPADFWAAEYPAHIDTVNENVHQFTVAGKPTTTCTSVTGTGTLNEESSELTSQELAYAGCHLVSFGITFNVTVDMNGCHYLLTAGTYTPNVEPTPGIKGKADGSVHVKCPQGKVIQITIKKLNGEPKCELDIGEQTPTSGVVTFNNETTEGKMAVTEHFEIVTHVTQTTIAAHDALCTNHETLASTYVGNSWVKATKPTGTYIDYTVTGTG